MKVRGGSFRYHVYQWVWALVDLFFPARCPGCQTVSIQWCPECQKRISLVESPICPKCGRQSIFSPDLCESCRLGVNSDIDEIRSWALFDGSVRKAVHHLKYQGNGGLGEVLSQYLIDILRNLPWQIDMVIPVPLAPLRFQTRGYNQSMFLARPLAYYYGFVLNQHALVRYKETRSQVGLNTFQRQQNVQGAFQANKQEVNHKNILLIDDVLTTGATINEAARSLKKAGARCVYGITLAQARGKANI